MVASQYVLDQINEDQYQPQPVTELFWHISKSLTYIDPDSAKDDKQSKKRKQV